MSRKLLGGGIESAAEWAAVASHENAHARGFLDMSGLATYLGVTKTLGITADEKLVTEMLFGAIMNDNSANEDGVYHWALTMKEDGSYGWREDGSLDFNISKELKKALFESDESSLSDEERDKMKILLWLMSDNNKDGGLTIGYEYMNSDVAADIGVLLGNNNSNETDEVSMSSPEHSWISNTLWNFVDGTMALKDVSTAYENAIQSIANRESDKARREDGLSDKYDDASVKKSLNDFFDYLVAADATNILVRNPAEDNMITDSSRLLQQETERGIETFPMALNEGETNLRYTTGYGYQALVYKDGHVRWRLHEAVDFVNVTAGTESSGVHLHYAIEGENPFVYWASITDNFVNDDPWGCFSKDTEQYSQEYLDRIFGYNGSNENYLREKEDLIKDYQEYLNLTDEEFQEYLDKLLEKEEEEL